MNGSREIVVAQLLRQIDRLLATHERETLHRLTVIHVQILALNRTSRRYVVLLENRLDGSILLNGHALLHHVCSDKGHRYRNRVLQAVAYSSHLWITHTEQHTSINDGSVAESLRFIDHLTVQIDEDFLDHRHIAIVWEQRLFMNRKSSYNLKIRFKQFLHRRRRCHRDLLPTTVLLHVGHRHSDSRWLLQFRENGLGVADKKRIGSDPVMLQSLLIVQRSAVQEEAG